MIVDTTVQEKAIAFPTDAKLMNRARERLVQAGPQAWHRAAPVLCAGRQGRADQASALCPCQAVQARQPASQAAAHHTGRGDPRHRPQARPAPGGGAGVLPWLSLARRIAEQRPRQRGQKVYALHAPEVECIGKGKAHKPYEFGVKVSVATTLERSRGGQFVTHVKALPGNPYDGHTLDTVIPEIETSVGASLDRIVADAGYRGHNAPKDKMFKVHVAGQKRGLTKAIKRAFRRRAAIEPVIGHLKSDHRMGRNFLASAEGDANNAVLAAVGYNFSLLLNWLRLLRAFFLVLLAAAAPRQAQPRSASPPQLNRHARRDGRPFRHQCRKSIIFTADGLEMRTGKPPFFRRAFLRKAKACRLTLLRVAPNGIRRRRCSLLFVHVVSPETEDNFGRHALSLRYWPVFISRSVVMNCCGRSHLEGALYPIERAISPTNALQL